MAILEKLREIYSISVKYHDYASAETLRKLIELHESGSDRFWDLLLSHEMWGGMGSVADQCPVFRPPVGCSSEQAERADQELKSDQRMVWRNLLAIAKEAQAAGRRDRKMESWMSVFRSWLKQKS